MSGAVVAGSLDTALKDALYPAARLPSCLAMRGHIGADTKLMRILEFWLSFSCGAF